MIVKSSSFQSNYNYRGLNKRKTGGLWYQLPAPVGKQTSHGLLPKCPRDFPMGKLTTSEPSTDLVLIQIFYVFHIAEKHAVYTLATMLKGYEPSS
ncbi:hypothetical protein AVEN_248976-1 [Araneus ventricosus]|uniref:Uncharacterized protein n=1 Tax=Araneus ventricosus TaxID=182803 RepID=A0A4Y2VNR4_ARAVE|nr:hypothetical protein AVEN_248976-1 [Araneus ventricosus]